MKRAALMAVTAFALIGSSAAATKYVPMKNAALVARSYQVYLNKSGFRQRCKALSAFVVRCSGTTETNDPKQLWHPWATEIRKVPLVRNGKRVLAAERRIWMDGKSLGKPGLDPQFVSWASIRGW